MSFKKEVIKELNQIYKTIITQESKIKILQEDNEILKELIEQYDTKAENKWTEHQKRLNEHIKKIEMLINSENEIRLAIKKMAEELAKQKIIKIQQKENENEWSKSKHDKN